MKVEIYFIVAALVLGGVIACVYLINKHYIKLVKKHSKQYIKLIELNESYSKIFIKMQPVYTFYKYCNSKSQFDNTYLLIYFYGIVAQELNNFERILQASLYNMKKNNDYIKEYKAIKSTITPIETRKLIMPFYKFVNIEKKLVSDSILKPVTNVSIKCVARYTSPAGRNSYSKEKIFNIVEIKKAIEYCQINIKFHETAAYQRSLMTDSLRYDIMRRDGFKCQLCGASAKDGVRLHVDHIIPVSKGGKTEPSNLRTLCERCNLGKRDKIE